MKVDSRASIFMTFLFYMNEGIKNSGIWVPQDMSELKKLLNLSKNDKPSIYGLPMFHIFYAKNEKYKGKWSLEKVNGRNNILHAFRIIVGLSWNWLMSNMAGYRISEYDLYGSITSLCYIATNKDKSISSTHWHDILNIGQEHWDEYCDILSMHSDIVAFNRQCFKSTNIVGLITEFFVHKLSKYIMNNHPLTMFVPLRIQNSYKDMYDKNAIEAYKFEHQQVFYFYADSSKSFADFAAVISPSELRTKCWFSPKQIQRALTKGGNNDKSKHGRNSNNNSTTATTTKARCATVGGRKSSSKELP